jgi:hypothetical protein
MRKGILVILILCVLCGVSKAQDVKLPLVETNIYLGPLQNVNGDIYTWEGVYVPSHLFERVMKQDSETAKYYRKYQRKEFWGMVTEALYLNLWAQLYYASARSHHAKALRIYHNQLPIEPHPYEKALVNTIWVRE